MRFLIGLVIAGLVIAGLVIAGLVIAGLVGFDLGVDLGLDGLGVG